MWLVIAIILLLMFGGGLLAGLGNLVYILLVLAVVFGLIHFIQRN